MRALLALVLVLVLLVVGAGCGGDGVEFGFTEDSGVVDGEPIPIFFTCDGEDSSPTLAWSGVPDGAQELAIVVEDPDAPGGTFTHWLVYGLDPDLDSLPNGIGPEPQMGSPRALKQGENDFGRVGYEGPCPPPGEEHDYVFRLVALHAPMDLAPGATRTELDAAIEPHVLDETSITAPYGRE
jgi:Raf kinase inhibitor-like YbhB/YbcL family protein